MASPAAYARSRGLVELACADLRDARQLRLAVVDALRPLGFDAYAWLLTDPATRVGTSPLADVPCLPELPKLIRLKYLTTVNRWTDLPAGGVCLLHAATGGDLAASRLWRELLRQYAVTDIASCVFKDRFGCWGFLDLWRLDGSGVFGGGDVAYLESVLEPVTAALRRSQASAFSAGADEPAGREPGPVVLLLSPDLEVRSQTPQTQDYLRTLVPPAADREPVPASAYNVGAALLAAEASIDPGPPSARVHLGRGSWVTLRAARIGRESAGAARDIAVTVEESGPAERAGLFTRAFGLSSREAELLGHLLAGQDTREVAGAMFVSEHTVQDHLKSIFGKTSTRSRRALLASVLGR
jgi:DNA-binding CsgD family transcriptional regulator